MPTQFTPQQLDYLNDCFFLWFTTVRDDGMPLPTPVWFVVDGDGLLIYTNPEALKVKNVRQHTQVALSHCRDEDGEVFIVITGEATPDPAAQLPSRHAGYIAKYRQGIADIDFTIEGFDAYFSLALRVTPHRIRLQMEEA